MKGKTRKALIGFLATATIACCAFAGITGVTPPQPITEVVAETTSNTRMSIESGEFVWNATTGIRTMNADSYTDADGYVGDRGLNLITGTTYPTTATVLHCPETATGTYTLSLSGSHVYRMYDGNAKLRFRLVKNNEVIYPADGTWADCNTKSVDLNVTTSLTMSAGDDLYFIVNDELANRSGAAVYVTAGMTIDGTWFDATSVNHIDPANDSLTTSNYFGGTYTYSELFTYEYITSWYDYEEEDIVDFSNYQKREVEASCTFTASGAKELWPDYNVDMRGAEYFAFTIDNSAGTENLKFVNRFRERGTASGDWGLFWSMTNNAEYFLLNEDNVLSRHDTVLTSNNDGALTVPAGFKGQVLVPITSYEITSWQLPATDSHYDRYVKFGEPTTPHLQMLYCLEFGLTNTPAAAVTVTDVQFWGSDLLTTYDVSDTYQTAIQAIDNIGVVTAASANQIIKAQTLYNNLSDANKALVSNYATLTAAIEDYKTLSDMSVYVGTYGKDFTDTDGVAFDSVVSESPSSVSAWIKVDKDIADGTHVGTIVGNMERTGSNAVIDSTATMSMEITTYGRPKFVWRKSKTEKVNFVVENVDVRTGSWLNLTFVRDTENNALHCYINGVKVATKEVDSADIADITFVNKPFMIGSDYTNDPITAPGFTPDFNGSIANVKLYSGILTDEQVASNLSENVADQGLMNDISFRSGDDGAYYDSAANVEVEDAGVWIENGKAQLKLGDYSFAILGDTQMMLSRAEDANGNSLYSTDYDYTSNVFYKNVQWLIANKEALNLQFVMHVGDLTDNGNTSTKIDTTLGSQYTYKYEQEFVYGVEWMSDLRENGIPYALARGNHETVANYETYYTAEANAQYVTADVTTTAEDGTETTVTGMYSSSSMRDVAYTLNVGNQKYLIVVLDYEPTNDEIAWANSVVAAHPTHRAIILTHKYMTGSNELYTSADIGTNYGELIWNNLVSQHSNIIMLVSGHASSPNVGRRVDTGVNGNKVLQLMVDESLIEYSGSRQTGVFALLGFENDGNTIHFNYYSPSEDKLYKVYNQFTVELDDDYFNDMDAGKTEYAKQEDLPLAIKPNFEAYPTLGASGFASSDSKISFSYSGFTIRKGYLQAVNLHMSADGIFYFDPASYLNGRVADKANPASFRLEVYLSNQDGTTRKVFPTRDGYYTIGETWGVWYLSQIGGVEVKNGDTITVAYSVLDTDLYCYGRFDGYIASVTGETLVEYTLKAGNKTVSSLASSDLNALNDGTKTDYSVGYVSDYDSYVFEKTLTVVDLDGNTLQTIPAGKNGYYVLPELSREGYVLAGYIVDGTLLPVGSTIQVTADTTITAAFVELSMFNGASVRVKVPTGIRFSTQIKQSQYAQLSDVGATVSFGTLIVMASDITVNGTLDYTLLTKGCSVKHLDVLSTVQVSSGAYTQFNGAVVGIKESNISKQFAARSYMQITYASGETAILYANVKNNARSVVEVAEKALADINTLQTKDYQYETDNGYSPYSLYEQEVIGKLKNGDLSLTPLTNEMKDGTYMHVLDASHISGYTLGGAGFTVLFEYQDQVVMIDTAWNVDPSTSRINEYLRERGINRIDHLILTHMHSDHAGGAPYFIENYDVGTIYMKPFDFQYSNTGESDAEYYALALKAAQRKVNSTGEAVTIVEPGVEGYTVELGEDTFFSIYNCTEIFETTTQLDGNTFSMMVYFKSGTATAFVGADSTSLADEFVLGNIGQVDVYTMQHHGTYGPYSSADLLAELQPTYSVSTTSPDELDRDNGDGVYDTSDGQRVRCEAYGQVINPYNDGNRYFKIVDGKFVLQGDSETRWANAQTVQITETEIAYTTSGRVTEDGNVVGNTNGTLVTAGKTTATALVLTVPESFPSTATVTLNDSILYKVAGGNARFRIVLNDKVVYPTEDGWLDFSDSSSENKVLIDLRLTVKAGDRLYFIVDGVDTNGVQTQAYMTMGLRIDGLWWDVVNVLHLNEADDNTPAAKNFFNGTLYNNGQVYARKDLISYMQVVVEDVEEA